MKPRRLSFIEEIEFLRRHPIDHAAVPPWGLAFNDGSRVIVIFKAPREIVTVERRVVVADGELFFLDATGHAMVPELLRMTAEGVPIALNRIDGQVVLADFNKVVSDAFEETKKEIVELAEPFGVGVAVSTLLIGVLWVTSS